MAVVLQNALFLHIPKTGGQWVREVLWRAGLEKVKLHPGRQKHADLQWFRDHPHYDRPFRFAFVRHPLSWYRSYWNYQYWRHWTRIPEVSLEPPAGVMSFPGFLSWVADCRPGFLRRLYERYIGPAEEPIELIGRTETIREDLARALKQSGHPIPIRLIRDLPMQNISPRGRGLECPAKIQQELLDAERALCERFGYQ